jgi:hypothetical protein
MTSAIERIRAVVQDKDPSQVSQLILDGCISTEIFAHGTITPFVNMKHLSLNSSKIKSLRNFPCLRNLEKLELSDNQIATGLNSLCIAQLDKLSDLDLSHNTIKYIGEVLSLKELPGLRSLDLSGCMVTNTPDYRETVFSHIPDLEILDGKMKKPLLTEHNETTQKKDYMGRMPDLRKKGSKRNRLQAGLPNTPAPSQQFKLFCELNTNDPVLRKPLFPLEIYSTISCESEGREKKRQKSNTDSIVTVRNGQKETHHNNPITTDLQPPLKKCKHKHKDTEPQQPDQNSKQVPHHSFLLPLKHSNPEEPQNSYPEQQKKVKEIDELGVWEDDDSEDEDFAVSKEGSVDWDSTESDNHPEESDESLDPSFNSAQ